MAVELSSRDLNEPEKHDTQMESARAVLLLTFLLLITLFTSYYLQKWKIRVLHESIIATSLGIITGLILHFTTNSIGQIVTFDHGYFFNLLLPPIILKSGFDLEVKHFFGNIGSILVFAFIGTFFSALAIGSLLFLVISLNVGGIGMSFIQCLMFGSILSSTDPVTILAIFNQIKVDPNLYALIFGESMLNDAVSIVLYDVLNGLQDSKVTSDAFFQGFGRFMTVFFGSTLVGTFVAFVSALLMKYSELYKYPAIETSVLILIAYSTYLLSNLIGLTGIVSLLFSGIAIKHYVFPNLSDISRKMIVEIFHVLAHLSENFIFIYLGISIFTQAHVEFRWGLILFTFLFILAARALSVFPLAKFLNFISKPRSIVVNFRNRPRVFTTNSGQQGQYLPWNYQVMLWWSGLRGAIAFALSMDINAESLNEVKTTTLIVVILSIFLLGGTTTTAMKRLKIELEDTPTVLTPGPEEDLSDYASRADNEEYDSLRGNPNGNTTRPDSSSLRKHWFLSFDQKYILPFFTRRKPIYRALTSPPGDFSLGRIRASEEDLLNTTKITSSSVDINPFVIADRSSTKIQHEVSINIGPNPSQSDLALIGTQTSGWLDQPTWDEWDTDVPKDETSSRHSDADSLHE